MFLSFTPYAVAFDLLVIIIYIAFYLQIKQNLKTLFDFQEKNLIKKKVSFIFFCVILLWLSFITIHDIWKVTKVYTQIHITDNTFQTNHTWLTVFYANIHKNNWTYTWLVEPIQKYNPDVVALVEYENEHHQLLQNFRKKNYPYSNRTYLENYAWNVIFSKYPIQDLASTVEQIPWRFGYISIEKYYPEWKSGTLTRKYFLYLVHTSSPWLYEEYKARNRQIQYFETIIDSQKELNWRDQSMILWDFNISPWSPFYWDFVDNVWDDWKNITTAIPLIMTWWAKKLPFPKVHIDHIFMSKSEYLISIEKINIWWIDHDWYNWSDHDGFVFQVK